MLGLLAFCVDLRVTLPRHRLLTKQIIHTNRGSVRLAINGLVMAAAVAHARQQMGQAISRVRSDLHANYAVSINGVVVCADGRKNQIASLNADLIHFI